MILRRQADSLRTAAALSVVAVLCAGVLGGCNAPETPNLAALGGEPPPPPPPSDQAALRHYAENLAPRYAAHPEDRVVAIRYARALRGLTQYAQAVAVLQRLAVKYPNDMIVLGAYGKALADDGRLQEAADVLSRSHTPDRPNWTILSAQGSVADQMGDHARAQAYYLTALKIIPNQPEVLSNLGLSYALQRQMAQAETVSRQAAAQPGADARVRQNLALVLVLRGEDQAAQEVLQRDMPPIEAADSLQGLKGMVAQSDQWKDLAGRTRVGTADGMSRHAVSRTASAQSTTRTAAADLQ